MPKIALQFVGLFLIYDCAFYYLYGFPSLSERLRTASSVATKGIRMNTRGTMIIIQIIVVVMVSLSKKARPMPPPASIMIAIKMLMRSNSVPIIRAAKI